MIFPDVNVLLYAEDAASAKHESVRHWWQAALSGRESVCLCWPVLCGFVRIATNPRVFDMPLSTDEACDRIEGWLQRPNVRVVHPTDQHWAIFRELIETGQCTGNLVTDAHLAALAIEHGCHLYSSDADFARFPRLKWRNPLDVGE